MAADSQRKTVRSYRVVFRRRWRIFRVQNWRIPLPGGLELRAIGYWLACLLALALLARVPLLGVAVAALPSSLRLLALPLLAAWGLSRWEVDGRSPHRAVAGLLLWRLRARSLAGLRRCPPTGSVLAPAPPIAIGADLRGPAYPRGRLRGPVRLLLRYPVAVQLQGVPRRAGSSPAERMATARRWRLSGTGGPPLHAGRTLAVPAGAEVVFE
jgi:hypothetical protein